MRNYNIMGAVWGRKGMRGEGVICFELGRGGQGWCFRVSPNSGPDFAFLPQSCGWWGGGECSAEKGRSDLAWELGGCQERKPHTQYSLLDSPRGMSVPASELWVPAFSDFFFFFFDFLG